jgi:hypothetical protein
MSSFLREFEVIYKNFPGLGMHPKSKAGVHPKTKAAYSIS